jgi:pimeloyl-ACP methyl ester carboxylesterase
VVLGRRSSEARNGGDARRHALTWDEHGESGGIPVLFFHGGGDSKASRHPDDTIASSLGVRLISVERCAIVDPARTLTGYARDVEMLTDELGLSRFSVLGWSAGGPHALAVAAKLPGRVSHVAVVAGMPPPKGLRAMPRDVRATIALARINPRLAVAPLERWGRRTPPPTGSADCDLAYHEGRRESFRNGGAWLAIELAMLGRSWGFALSDVRAPVTLWYGARDVVCPPKVGEAYARDLPHATLKVVDDTHQLLFSQWVEILRDLATHELAARAARIFR